MTSGGANLCRESRRIDSGLGGLVQRSGFIRPVQMVGAAGAVFPPMGHLISESDRRPSAGVVECRLVVWRRLQLPLHHYSSTATGLLGHRLTLSSASSQCGIDRVNMLLQTSAAPKGTPGSGQNPDVLRRTLLALQDSTSSGGASPWAYQVPSLQRRCHTDGKPFGTKKCGHSGNANAREMGERLDGSRTATFS